MNQKPVQCKRIYQMGRDEGTKPGEMSKIATIILLGLALVFSGSVQARSFREVDICVYGGTSGGVIAAYTAMRPGKTVLMRCC